MFKFSYPVSWAVLLLPGLGCLMGCTNPGNEIEARVSPVITGFAASPALVAAGGSTTLMATFANGTGVITPGNLTVASGTPVTVTPSVTTPYTLTVTSTAGMAATQSASVTVTAVPAPPSIASFGASPATIAAGESTLLTGIFANGTGVISPGNLTVSSGTPVSVTPAATTTYSLTVTNSTGSVISESATVTVTPTAQQSAELGVNIGWVNDWDPTQMFADAMKQARKFGSVSAPYDESAGVDAQGWPTQDAGVAILIGNRGAWTAGTYALSFTGQASVRSWDDASVSVGAVTYNSATNTSTATVTVGPAYSNVYLVFTQTRRMGASGPGTGITNVSLMRPTINGTPHAAGTLFTDRFLERLKYFTAMRMMDYLETNSSSETAWTDRSIPANASQQETPPHASQNIQPQFVTGASYEYAIQLANQTGKDLWLTVPNLAFGGTYAFASTTWATNLALLLKYGSDVNGNPYTGLSGSDGSNPQPATGPVNPPLNAGLHVYIEYSNEFWSGVGNQSAWIQQQAAAAIAAGDPDLDWDHDPYATDLEWRIEAKGVMLIADSFAGVYGSGNFGTVYRPIFSGQIANSGTYAGLDYLDSQHGGANQYVWAIAGAPYVDFNGDVYGNTATASQILSGMQAYQITNIVPWIGTLSATATGYHLQGGMVAYEGGQGALYGTAGAIAAQTNPAMRSVITADLDAWFAQGGGTFFYYKLCSTDTWGLSTDIGYDIDADSGYSANPADSTEAQPKWGAIKQVATLGH
jgi:hypothetical protein